MDSERRLDAASGVGYVGESGGLMTPTQIEAAQKVASEWLAAFQKRGGK